MAKLFTQKNQAYKPKELKHFFFLGFEIKLSLKQRHRDVIIMECSAFTEVHIIQFQEK